MDTPVIHPGHAYVVVIRFVSVCCRVQFTFIKFTSIQVLVFYHVSIHIQSVLIEYFGVSNSIQIHTFFGSIKN